MIQIKTGMASSKGGNILKGMTSKIKLDPWIFSTGARKKITIERVAKTILKLNFGCNARKDKTVMKK